MFFWWLVVGILVASIVLLTLLLAPLPTFLVSAAVQLLNYIQRPLWLVLVLISWVLVDASLEMRKYSEEPTQPSMTGPILAHNNKWRAERNFYLSGFTWTLLLIVLRCHYLARSKLELIAENRRMRTERQTQ